MEEVQDRDLALGRLTSLRVIFAIAVPAALFRVSDVLSSTLQTSLVSKHGGTEMLAAFAAVGVTTRTTLKLFAFMLDGVAAKVGRSAAHEPAQVLRARLRLYFVSCLVLGLIATAVLLAGQDHILLPFNLTTRVRELADPYWVLLSLLLPLMLTNMAISGTLQGLRHVGLSAALEALGAAAEIAGTYAVLTASWLPRHSSRLAALGLVKLGVTVVTSGAGLSLIAWLLPRAEQQQQHQHQQHLDGVQDTLATPLLGAKLPTYSSTATPDSLVGLDPPSPTSVLPQGSQQQQQQLQEQGRRDEQGPDSESAVVKGAGRPADRAGVALAYLAELVRDGLNVMTRSIVVQGSMWLTAVAAARLGTAPLAAHQILTQLWMLPSHFFGGFAVAAIVLGSRLALQGGEVGASSVAVRRAQRRLSSRLVVLAAFLGAAVGCALALWKPQAITFFHPKDGVAPALSGPAWHAMCALQPLTAALFTLTGLIFGAQLFAFMRNVLLAGFLGLFCPLLYWVAQNGPEGAAGLGAVWRVKVGFYVWQVLAEAVGVGRAYGYFAR